MLTDFQCHCLQCLQPLARLAILVKSAGSCAFSKESMGTMLHFPVATDFKDVNLWLAGWMIPLNCRWKSVIRVPKVFTSSRWFSADPDFRWELQPQQPSDDRDQWLLKRGVLGSVEADRVLSECSRWKGDETVPAPAPAETGAEAEGGRGRSTSPRAQGHDLSPGPRSRSPSGAPVCISLREGVALQLPTAEQSRVFRCQQGSESDGLEWSSRDYPPTGSSRLQKLCRVSRLLFLSAIYEEINCYCD